METTEINYHVITYTVYLVLTIAMTTWVARSLYKNGQAFLNEVYGTDTELAKSVNKLLLIGFYLLNFGFIVYALKVRGGMADFTDVFEVTSKQVGRIILVLGVMHVLNLAVFFNMRRKAINQKDEKAREERQQILHQPLPKV
jgi:uncharacterized BrkB/YihY/UPF0761 family membrane protein